METGRDRSPIQSISRLRNELDEYFTSEDHMSLISNDLPNRFHAIISLLREIILLMNN